MILNKFRSVSLYRTLKAFSLELLAISLFSCNKTANINANKAFIAVTHMAYGVGPISVTLDGNPLFPGTLSFGNYTGGTQYSYDTAISRVSNMIIQELNTTRSLSGYTSFQQYGHYSIFVYDTLGLDSLKLIMFQDNQPVRTDTFTYYRFLNFTPDSYIGLKLINNRKDSLAADTVIIGPNLFVGNNSNPGNISYTIFQIRIGSYNVFAFTDSSNPYIDSSNHSLDSSNFMNMGNLQIDSTINYNLYLQGFIDSVSGPNRFQLKSVPIN